MEHWTMWKMTGKTRSCDLLGNCHLVSPSWLQCSDKWPAFQCLAALLGLVSALPGHQIGAWTQSKTVVTCSKTCDTRHWAWRTLKGKRGLWLWVPVWIKGSAVYTRLCATGRRQEIGSAWGSTGKQPKYWHLEDIWFLLYFKERDTITCWWMYKIFFSVTS